MPQSQKEISTKNFEYNLEALRAFAALAVLTGHAFGHKFSLDPSYSPAAWWVKFLPGHDCVLVFFILSGYVIGLTNKTNLTRNTIWPYLRKRWLRLYPIYIACLLLTVVVIGIKSPERVVQLSSTIAGHLLFLQTAFVPLTYENNPLWSLHNEVVYYILFIPISLFNIRPLLVCLVSALVGIICATLVPAPLLSSYGFGMVFWSSGLWLAQSSRFATQYSSPWLLWGLLSVFLSYSTLNPIITAFVKLENMPQFYKATSATIGPTIFFHDLVQLPFLFYLFCCFSNRTIKHGFWGLLVSVGTCYLYFVYTLFKYGVNSPNSLDMVFPVGILTLGTALVIISRLRSQPSVAQSLPATFIKLGSISYGIYVVHFPVSLLLSHIPVFSGSVLTFCVRLAVDVALVLGIAYFLEKKLQPWVKARLAPPMPHVVGTAPLKPA